MPKAKLTTKGQLVIPKPIRKHLDIHPGDMIDFVVQDDGEVLVRPAVADVRDLKGLLHRPGGRAVSVDEMNRAIRTRGGRRR